MKSSGNGVHRFENIKLKSFKILKMDLQTFIENKIKAERFERVLNSDQLTLGQLISQIEVIINKGYQMGDGSEPTVCYDFEYLFPTSIDSWRGSYDELALNFETSGSELTASKFIELLKSADGKTFTGYKGGDYVMGEDTPIWVANYGHSGNTAVIGVIDCGYKIVIQTAYREY